MKTTKELILAIAPLLKINRCIFEQTGPKCDLVESQFIFPAAAEFRAEYWKYQFNRVDFDGRGEPTYSFFLMNHYKIVNLLEYHKDVYRLDKEQKKFRSLVPPYIEHVKCLLNKKSGVNLYVPPYPKEFEDFVILNSDVTKPEIVEV